MSHFFAEKLIAVYILSSKPLDTLYVGVTSNLMQRIWQHKNDVLEGFTKTHQIHRLVYFEMHTCMENAIVQEKQLKSWHRAWKIRLIETDNPQWDDLWPSLIGDTPSLDRGFRRDDAKFESI